MLNGPQGPTPSVEKTLYKVQDIKFDVIHVFNDELIDHYTKLFPENSIVNTQYIDGLFNTDTNNEKVGATVKLTTKLEEVKNPYTIKKIMLDYVEVL